jgi:hypothetical protein
MSDWSIDNIRTKLAELKLREKLLKKDAEILKAELAFLQSVCDHPNKRSWTHHDYGGGSDYHEACDDCGLHTCQ